ncbi:hypothetical protein OBBRIDRAFT_790817 [Obba rivulosa]|uniref:Amino acid permease/ SLC12A domain-containing protein n=1 Tax=Obba rivulosa TaxID=1052685 RepID=A0A8E2B364_9APHY|nr:hypothetical protein OBBRIDRAFT_790817 [Obba rivulosa]
MTSSATAFRSVEDRDHVRGRMAPTARSTQRVQIHEPPPFRKTLHKQSQRMRRFQQRWKSIKEDLPPQLTRRHIGMISIGGVIGTGLFVGSAQALENGGPIGALLGYMIIGSVVYCLCVSIGEMIAFMPNVGGVVGLAGLYVDEALGFSLGWSAWYNWSVTLPTEISAAILVIEFWYKDGIPTKDVIIFTSVFLSLATAINLLSSHRYGEVEFYLSSLKVVTIVVLIVAGLLIDLGAIGKQGRLGFKNWTPPFANYLGIEGAKGYFLGFWAVMMQAGFSFFGSEVPGIAAGEVIDATRNVPRALQKVWIRITLFYVGAILVGGLIVKPSDLCFQRGDSAPCPSTSPFIVAFNKAGIKVLPHVTNAAILLSAWSAAASDIYISSRFLFFLARCRHAPSFLGSLLKYPQFPSSTSVETTEDDTDDDIPSFIDIRVHYPEAVAIPVSASMPLGRRQMRGPPSNVHDLESTAETGKPWLVIPVWTVLISASVGLLAFTSSQQGATQVFKWLSSAASVASLQSWIGMLFTYIRWFKGTVYAEERNRRRGDESQEKVMSQIDLIKKNRHKGQPYLAWYAFSMCTLILLTSGWSVFINSNWHIALVDGDPPPSHAPGTFITDPVPIFLSSYIPLPIFVLLALGYKLIKQTRFIRTEDMDFSGDGAERVEVPDGEPQNLWEKFLQKIHMI